MYQEYLYKEQLLNTLSKDDELVDNVKVQLRQKIINKLKNNKPPSSIPTDKQLITKICNCLFLQYLQTHSYFHSASVFAPESGQSKNQFSNEQLKSLFRVSQVEGESLLESVVKQVMPKGRLTEKKVQTAIQTDGRQTIQNLENRLSQVDFSYKQKMMVGLKTVEDSEARFLKYKNEVNKRYKQQLQAEITRIRDFQIANIRMEEQDKNKLKMRQFQEELELSYRNKMEKLREREAEVIQRVANKMKQIESYNFQARQRMLRDLESVKAREQQIQNIKSQLEQKERNLAKKI